MKKNVCFIGIMILCMLAFVGCKAIENGSEISESFISNTDETQNQASQPTTEVQESLSSAETVEEVPVVVKPLPVTLDITNLDNCTAAISLEKGDFYTNAETGSVMMDVTVFVYDLYDMVDIALLKEGDTIVRLQNEVSISTIERKENGQVVINGGIDQGGFVLHTEDNTVYYELGYSDAKAYYELGTATLPVSPGFIYTDASDLDKAAATYTVEDFLKTAPGIRHHFNANNTTIEIKNGYVMKMTMTYAP